MVEGADIALEQKKLPMKRISLHLLGLALVLVAGCVVTSIYPYYAAKDVVFDPTLLGTWSDPAATNAGKDSWAFAQIDAQTYKLTVKDASKQDEFDVHLFALGGQQFLDCLPRERHDYATPAHVLLRVKHIQSQLEMDLLNYEWLGKLVETNPKSIRHIIAPNPAGDSQDRGLLTLTADTAELQKFILKHLHDTNAWSEPVLLKKQ